MPTATLTSQPDRGVGGGNQALNPLALASPSAGQAGGPRARRTRRRTTPVLGRPPFSRTSRSRHSAHSPFLESAFLTVCATWVPPRGAGRGGCGGGVAFCAAGWGWGWGWGNCIETSLPKQTAWGCESRASPAHARSGAGGRRSGRPGRAENPSAPCPCPGDAQGLPRPPPARSPLPTPLRGAAFRRGHHQAAARRSWRRRRGAGRRPAPGLAGVAGSPGPGGAGGRLPSGAAEMRTEAPALSRPCPPPGGRSGCGVPRAGSVAVFTFCLLAWVGLFL